MIRGRIALAAIYVALALHPARADQVADLTKTLTTSSSEKTRLSAVIALAKLGDKRALKPLVTALHDPSAEVRAAATVALGHLGHKASLPALKDLAANDPDDSVRAKAHTAATLVAKANHITDDSSPAVADGKDKDTKEKPKPPKQGGFGHSPHAVEDHPDLYVSVKSSSDDSPGKSDKTARKVHADDLRQTLVDAFKAQPQITMAATDAQKYNLDLREVDLSIVKLEANASGGYMEIEAELRLAVSDDKGRMQSFLSGGAKVSVPKAKYDAKFLPQLQKEAIENAMRGMFDKLCAHLRKTSQS